MSEKQSETLQTAADAAERQHTFVPDISLCSDCKDIPPVNLSTISCHNPFTSSLQELVNQQHKVGHYEPDDEECKEFRSILNTKLQPDLSLVAAFQPRIFYLASNPI